MSEDYTPEAADCNGVWIDNETYNDLVQAANDNTTRQVNESADHITLKTRVKRGDDVRNEDKVDVKVKGSDPAETAKELAVTLDELENNGVAETLRETQPGESNE